MPAAKAQSVLKDPASSQSVAELPSFEALDSYIENAREELRVPGTAVVIVKDDKIVYAKGFGVREIGGTEPVNADTVFAIGSSSKAFTGAALAMLVDDEEIEWDGVVHEYMPAFELSDPYVTNHATVRDLLAHRTGFISGWGWLWTGSGFDRDEIIDHLRFQKELSGFRDKFLYANEMFTVAGEIIPAVTGTSWDDFVKTRIFKPLGMTRSHTSVMALTALQNVASPHGLINGEVTPFPYRNVDNVGGAGSINASARDMAQWVRLQLNEGEYEGERLISEEAVQETHSGQMVQSGSGDDDESHYRQYGLGWMVYDYRGKKIIEHGGAVDGMRAGVAMMPEEDLGVIVLNNFLPTPLSKAVERKVFDIFLGGGETDWIAKAKKDDEAAKKMLAKRQEAQPKSPKLSKSLMLPLKPYAGIYQSDLYGKITVTLENGYLILKRPTAEARLIAQSENQFKARWEKDSLFSVFGATPVRFTIGSDGKSIALDLGTDRFQRQIAEATKLN